MSDDRLWQQLQAEDFRLSTGATLADHLGTYTTLGRDKAALLVEEYRRFLYLVLIREGIAVPSPLVDAVWHKHLQDTRAYQAMAERIGQFVHHAPGRPSPTRDPAYFETLRRYETTFGMRPPAAIWPRRDLPALFRWLSGLVFTGMLALMFVPMDAGWKSSLFGAGWLAVMGMYWLSPWALASRAFPTGPSSSAGFLFGSGGDGCGGDGGGCGGD